MKMTFKNLKNTVFTLFSSLLSTRTGQVAMLLVMAHATGIRAHAAGNGMAGINEATSMVTSYFDPGV